MQPKRKNGPANPSPRLFQPHKLRNQITQNHYPGIIPDDPDYTSIRVNPKRSEL